jgi:hypothetical protein
VEAQDLGRAVRAVNDPTRLLKGGQNVAPHGSFQRFERWRLLYAARARRLRAQSAFRSW